MGWAKTMMNYLTGHRQRCDDELAVVQQAIAFQKVKGEVLRNQLTKEMRGLHSVESRMYEAFAGLQAEAGRARRGHTK